MIELKIISSTDPDVIGIKQFYKNLIYFGKNKGDILINDDEIIDYHMFLEVTANRCLIHLHKNIDHFHLNNKLTNGIVSINPNDIIKIGSTTFTLITSTHEEEPDKSMIISKKLDEILSNDSPLLKVLSKLEQDFKGQ